MKGIPSPPFVDTLTAQELASEFLSAAKSRELRAVLVHGFPGSGKTENAEHFLLSKLREEQFVGKCSIEPVESSEIVRGDCGAAIPNEKDSFRGFEQVTRQLDERARLRRRGMRILSVLVELVGVDVDKVLGLLDESPEHMGRFQRAIARTLEKLREKGTGTDAYISQLVSKRKSRPLVLYIDNVQNMGRDGLQLIRQLVSEQPEGVWGIILLEYRASSHRQPPPILWQLVKEKALSSVFTRRLNPAQLRHLVEGTLGESLLTDEELEQLVSVLGGSPGNFHRLLSQWEARELVERTPAGWKRRPAFGILAMKPPEIQYLDEFLPKFAGDGKIDEGERRTLAAYAGSLLLDENRTAEIEELGQFIASHSQYEIIKYVRRGILGSVYEGRDKDSGQAVLVEVERRVEIDRRPKSEVSIPAASSARGDQTPFLNVLTVDDKSAGRTVVVTEFAGGYTLTELTTFFTLSSYQVCLEIAEKLLIRLRSLHDRSKCHGRLRPEGIIYNPDNGAMSLVDFVGGCAEIKAPQELHPFLSPEQLASPSNAYLQSDVFAIGLVLYQMLQGRQPWEGPPGEALRSAIMTHALQQNSERPLDKKVFKVLSKALQKDHYDRYDSAGNMLDDVRKAAQALPVWKPKRKKVASSGRPRPLVYAIPLACLLVAFAWFFGPALLGGGGKTEAGLEERVVPMADMRGQAGPEVLGEVTSPPLGFVAEVTLPTEQHGKHWFLIVPFQYGERAEEMVPALSLEYLLKFSLMGSVENLIVVDKTHFDAFLKSHGASQVVPRYRLEGKVSEKTLAATATLTLELTLSVDGQSHTKAFDLEKSHLLKSRQIGQMTCSSELAQVQSWLTQIAPGFRLSAAGEKPLGILLTSEWEAFEHFFKAEKAWSDLNVGVARAEYRDALNYDEDFLLARLGLAEVYSFDGSSDRAVDELEKIAGVLGASESLETGSRDLPQDGRQEYAALQEKMIRHSIAGEERIRKELKDKFRFLPKTHYDLAEVYFHSGRCEEAIGEYSIALDYNSDFSKALNHRSYCHAYRGEFAESLADLQRYVEPLAERDRANAYDSLGDIHLFSGDYAKALEYKSKACSLGRESYMVLSRAKVLMAMGRSGEARAVFERLRGDAGSTGVRATSFLAFMAYMDGDLEHALELVAEASERYPAPKVESGVEMGEGSVEAPFRSETRVVFRHPFIKSYWVLPFWIDGLIAYESGDRARLADLCRFLYHEVRGHYGLKGDGLYKPVSKFHHHLRALRISLTDVNLGGARPWEKAEEVNTFAPRLDYWTAIFGRSFFYTDYARLAFEKGDLAAADGLLETVLGNSQTGVPAYNDSYVPALVLRARLKHARGDANGALALLAVARRNLDEWQAEDDSYLSRMVEAAQTELFPPRSIGTSIPAEAMASPGPT